MLEDYWHKPRAVSIHVAFMVVAFCMRCSREGPLELCIYAQETLALNDVKRKSNGS